MQRIIEHIILLLGRIKDLVKPFKSAYDVGDMVVLKDGSGYPMLVTEVKKTKKMDEPLLYCRWFDRKTGETRFNFFPESKLKAFDWSKQ